MLGSKGCWVGCEMVVDRSGCYDAPGFWGPPVEILAVVQCNLGQVALRTWYWHARDDWESWVGSAVYCNICLPNSGGYKGAVLSYGCLFSVVLFLGICIGGDLVYFGYPLVLLLPTQRGVCFVLKRKLPCPEILSLPFIENQIDIPNIKSANNNNRPK